ncbi:AlpA family phage regulatory protein [Burkholderia sp. WSM2230]|uniref:AlpA family phage regulatory protein n=1 Tax=Burkholderia sp. WSM2230 TaxID=944435 RepID=UPI0012EBD2C2
MYQRNSDRTGHAASSIGHEAASHRRDYDRERDEVRILLKGLSPTAVALWPTVARQLRDAGVLDAVDSSALASYCEAFAHWSQAADRLAEMLIEFGVKAGCRAREHTNASQRFSQQIGPASTDIVKEEPMRRAANAIMRRVEVERETGLARSTIYQRVRNGTFPAPVKLGPGATGWRVAEIEAFLTSPANYRAETADD